jgi:hypothetical protein
MIGHYATSVAEWTLALAGPDNPSRTTAETFFRACSERGFPQDNSESESDNEPERWCGDAKRGARRFQVVMAALYAASTRSAALRPTASPHGIRHAVAESGESNITLMWGNDCHKPLALIDSYLAALRERGAGSEIASKLVLFLLSPDGSPSPLDATQMLRRRRQDEITSAGADPMADRGEVVDARHGQELFCIPDGPVRDAIAAAQDRTALHDSLLHVLEVLE